jgi:D-amino-acid dehydrogenase
VGTGRVVVVGGGVAGAAAAWSLARGGAAVTVVDHAGPGAATAAGAGIVQPWSSTTEGPFGELYGAGAAAYPRLVAELAEDGATDVGWAVPGSLVVDDDRARLDEVAARVRVRTAGLPGAGTVERLSPAEARALFPPLAPELGAVLVPGGGRVDGRRLRAGLLAAARRHGAELVTGEARTRLDARGATVVTVDGERVPGDDVVLAAGAWTDRLLAPLGRSIGVTAQRGQLVHLFAAGEPTGRWPSVLPPGGHYLVAFEEGRVVAGATRETGSGFDPRSTAAGLREVLDRALAVAPGLAGATLLETRVGLRPVSDRGRPVIGAVPGRPGLWVLAGFGAAGLTLGPLAGRALADLLITGRAEADLSPFTP